MSKLFLPALLAAVLGLSGPAQASVVPTHHSSVTVRAHSAKASPVRYVARRVYVRVRVAHRKTVWRSSVRRFWLGGSLVTVTRRTPVVQTSYSYRTRPKDVRVAVRL